MKNYMYIKSDGEMPIESFSMMGVSTKRDDEETIGQFGTGLKYAIAGLMRNNVDFYIITERIRYDFTTKEINVKGQKFNQIRFKRSDKKRWKDLGFSKEMGLLWDLNACLREIVSNSIDEGGFDLTQPEGNNFEYNGGTVFAIELTPSVFNYFDNFDNYFLYFRDPVYSHVSSEYGDVNVYRAKDNHTKVYHKGVLVYEDKETKSLYDYEFSSISINEARRSSFSDIMEAFTSFITRASLEFKKEIFEKIKNGLVGFETNVRTYHGFYENKNMEDWNSLIGGNDTILLLGDEAEVFRKHLKGKKCLMLNNSWTMLLTGNGVGVRVGDALSGDQLWCFNDYALSDYEARLFDSAIAFIRNAGYDLKFIEFKFFTSDNGFLGNAVGGKLWISDLAFRNGKKDLIDTILHEYFHIVSKYEDETRDFENYIISELVKQLELKTGEML